MLLVLAGLLAWGILWAKQKADHEVCRQVQVVVVNNDSATFVTSKGILEDLKAAHLKIEGLPLWQINSDRIEQKLAQSPYLESVDCVKSHDGIFVIKVKQLVPVLRVFDGDHSYYVNRDGKRMEARVNYFSDVPIVNGHFTKEYGPERLLPLVDYVNRNATLSAIVTMYTFQDSDNIFVVPCMSGHIVNLGSIDNYESKFDKLLLFYRKVMPVRGWDTYDTLSVKWNHQVVATRRVIKAEEVIEASANDDEPDVDISVIAGDDNMPLHNVGGKPKKSAPAPKPKTTARKATGKAEPPQKTTSKKEVKKEVKKELKKEPKKDTSRKSASKSKPQGQNSAKNSEKTKNKSKTSKKSK